MTPIAPWHRMAREQLEREYSPRLLVADLQRYLDQYAELSAAARALRRSRWGKSCSRWSLV